jgi:SAM-dependent methyltransferase
MHSNPERGLKIDLGCGSAKREGFIGVDYVSAPGVDYVVDLTKERLPFADASVDHVFSAHFLEHIGLPNQVFQEIGRVCRDHATIEFWTPYAFSHEGFIYGHVTFLTEEPWYHFCCDHRDAHLAMLGGRWQLRHINYVVAQRVVEELAAHSFSMHFAIRYFKAVVAEFGVEIEFRRDQTVPAIRPQRTYSYARYSPRFPLDAKPPAAPAAAQDHQNLSENFNYVKKLFKPLLRGAVPPALTRLARGAIRWRR